MGLLDEFRILDLTRLQPGPYATMVLGDLGADVIKVEEPGKGDYIRWTPPMVGDTSAMHLVINRNKRSVTLNLKKPRGVELLKELVKKSDALVESYRPGVMQRLGIDYASLRELHPGLVYGAITGFGQDGPYRDRVGHDINYIAMSGVLGSTGEHGGPPVLPSVQVADLAGGMMAALGLLAALLKRTSTGKGEFIDASMTDAAYSWQTLALAAWFGGDEPLRPSGGLLNGGFPFYRVYECSDGKFISVGAIEPQFWESVCAGVGYPELANEQFAEGARREEIHQILESKFKTKSRDDWVLVFEGTDSCVAPVNDFVEASADPQLRSRGMVLEQTYNSRSLGQVGPSLKILDEQATLRLEAPALGQHNEDIYGELGVGPDEIAELKGDGVL